MTILVQRPDTKEYLCDAGQWSYDAQRAVVFKTVSHAADVGRALGRVHIVVKFSDERPPLIVPVGKRSKP